MNAVLWRCNLRVSWKTQLLSLLVHCLIILAILIMPWDETFWGVWLFLLTAVIVEGMWSQKRISSTAGELLLKTNGRFLWKQQEWIVRSQPLILKKGIFLRLQHPHEKQHERLWLAIDSMSQEEWSHLRRLLLHTNQNKVKGHQE